MRIYRIEDISGKGFYSSSMLISRETYQHFHGDDHPEIWSDHIDDLNTISLKYKIMEKYEYRGISYYDWYYGFDSYKQMKRWFMFSENAWADLKKETNLVIVTYKVHKAHTIIAKRQTVFLKEKAEVIDKVPVKMMENLHD